MGLFQHSRADLSGVDVLQHRGYLFRIFLAFTSRWRPEKSTIQGYQYASEENSFRGFSQSYNLVVRDPG